MHEAKSQPTPMTSTTHLTRHDTIAFNDPTFYRSITDALQYVIITRPELSYSVKWLIFLQNLYQKHIFILLEINL